jgi:hypothetical protein
MGLGLLSSWRSAEVVLLIDSFFDQRYEGEFNLLNFSVSISHDYAFPDRSALDSEQLLQAVMASTTLFHEYRHFHDLVGTPCGLHTMLHVTRLVDKFLNFCRTSGTGSLSVPLRKNTPNSSLVALFDEYQSFLKTICGDLPSEPAPSDGPAIRPRVVRTLDLDLKLPLMLLTDIDPLAGEARNRFVPIGLRALMEACAIDTQIFLAVVGAGDPDLVDKREMIARGERALELGSQIIRGGFLVPYAVCSLEYHYFTREFPPLASLTALCDASLTYSGFSEAAFPGTSPTFDHPGIVFVNLLQGWAQLPKSSKRLQLSQRLTKVAEGLELPGYESVISDIASRAQTDPYSLAPRFLGPDEAKSPFIGRIRRYLFHDFGSIMQQKAAAPEKWLVAPEYLRQYEKLPLPPLVSIAGTGISGHRPKAELVDWILWIFLLSMITDLVENHQLTCPILSRFAGLANLFSFEDPSHPEVTTNCVPFIAKQCCGSYNGQFKIGQPECPFTTHVRHILNSFSFDRVDFTEEVGH